MEPGFVPRIVLALQIDVREIQWQLNVRDKFPSPGLGVWRKSPDVSLRFFTPGTWQVGGGRPLSGQPWTLPSQAEIAGCH